MSGIADLGFAKLDLARQDRCGFPEVIYAPGKTPQALVQIVERLRSAGQTCLATRVDDEQARLLATAFPEAEQDRVGRTFFWPTPSSAPAPGGRVLVVTAGTADLPVAHEAA
ncbi:MAG TPA: 1-(5-phosphoribosyl)-5-amino-4-imidazole-carboxylate carboxylase, partial [Gemmatales bacterium]|nr:1-(5-phosphoribosyl)-5-amino-4-imidazole-carboxylate carboxylase [Gemmatales bacterium]